MNKQLDHSGANESQRHLGNELKYIIANQRSGSVLQWLKCNCRPDPQYPAGVVNSIYFDTRDWQALGEKINSDYLKTKVRLRWYADINGGHAYERSFAEVKYRIGYKRQKIRIPVPHSGTDLAGMDLHNPLLLRIPQLLKSHGVRFGRTYFPVYHIAYKRFRFREPLHGGRICFDKDIRIPQVNCMAIARQYPLALQTAVFEYKGAFAEFPESLFPLLNLGLRKASFSKYGACFQKLAGR